MSDDLALPVKGITKALDTGLKLAKRVSKVTSSASVAQLLQVAESARRLQKTLEESSRAITDAYHDVLASCGEAFPKALVEESLQGRLKDLRSDLTDHVGECQEFDEDEPETFAVSQVSFANLETQSRECARICLNLFNDVRNQITEKQSSGLKERVGDDRTQLSSMRQPNPGRTGPKPSQQWGLLSTPLVEESVLPLAINTPSFEPPKPKSPWSMESPSQIHTDPLLRSSFQQSSQDVPPPSEFNNPTPLLIGRDIVRDRLSANDDFLERRRQSRLLFQKQLRTSITSVEECRISEAYSDSSLFQSPVFEQAPKLPSSEQKPASSFLGYGSPSLGELRSPVSPMDGRGSRASGYMFDSLPPYISRPPSQGYASATSRESASSSTLAERQSHLIRSPSQGHASATSRGSIASSIVPERPPRAESQASQESIFGLRLDPLSPTTSEHGSIGIERWDPPAIAATLHIPGYGEGVESGIEVVDRVDRENGLMLAMESLQKPLPPVRLPAEYAIPHDSSFYKFGGFCEGAKAMLRGESGFKIVKRPSGTYNTSLSARCVKCSYEVDWKDVERDRKLERSGIFGNNGIRWRQNFIAKCHVKTNSIEEPIYACIFCIEEHKTVEEHDATVFFSVTSLFRHLAKHSQPVPNIAGLSILYGFQPPEVVDFDLNFTNPEPIFSQYSMLELGTKTAIRPTACATITQNPKITTSKSRDPDGNLVLNFAVGARIVAITFPDHLGGAWCVGYHDGARGAFPASAVTLEMPPRGQVPMNAQSTLVAYAKWDFKPKDAKDGGWLKFSKGERIGCVGYIFQDQWCWSGQNAKGKWGLFPSAFVGDLAEVRGHLSSSPGSGSVRSLRIGSFPLGRKKSTKKEASPTMMAAGAGGIGRGGQPGLEVVEPPSSRSTGWRG